MNLRSLSLPAVAVTHFFGGGGPIMVFLCARPIAITIMITIKIMADILCKTGVENTLSLWGVCALCECNDPIVFAPPPPIKMGGTAPHNGSPELMIVPSPLIEASS